MKAQRFFSTLSIGAVIWLCLVFPVVAQSLDEVKATLDNIWVLVAAILVIFMNAGFAMIETGFCRRKNAVNILAKNLIVFALATLAFWATGFAWMFGAGNLLMGNAPWFLSGTPEDYGLGSSTLTVPTFFLFQTAFAGTAAPLCRAPWQNAFGLGRLLCLVYC